MKKVLLTIATAAVMLVGCNSDIDIRPINTQKLADFYGEISAETRTQLTENQSDNTSYAAWVDGEFISIFYLSNPNNQYKVCDITNEGKNARFTPTGVFTDVTDADYKDFSKHYAIYPYSENNKMFEEGVITTILPATQTYNPESNLAYVPMVASSENTSLSFVIPTSLMRVSVSRNNPLRSTLKQIILSSENADIPLAGEIEFDMNGANVVTTVKGTENAIVLDLGEGVAITTEAVDYYISLPPVTFPAKNAMTVTLVYTQGNTTKQYVKTWSDKELVFNAGDRKGTSIVLSLEDFNGSTAYPATGGELVGNLTLTTDMNIKQPLTVPAGEEATINLNGKNITAGTFAESNGAVTEGTTDSYAFWVKEGAKLTINGDGKVKTDACKYSMAVWAQGGEVIINGGYYENAGEGSDLIYASAGSKIIINGGEFKACPKQPGVEGTAEEYSALNLKDNTGSQIIVYGGKFHNFDPANNTSEGAGTNFVAEGYISVETSEGVWEVFPATESIEVASAAALEDVLAQGGKATLAANIVLEKSLTVTKDATLNLNGNNITCDKSDVLVVTNGTLTINGEGVVYGSSDNSSSASAVWAKENGNVVINGGTFKVGDDESSKASDNWRNDCIYARDNATITINGGKFQYTGINEEGHKFLLNLRDANNTTASIVVNGGEFYKFDPANNASENPAQSFVAEGYISVETSENVWEVFPATEPVEVATAAALEDVLAQGASAVLTADITANGAITVPATATSTIDLNGNTLDYSAATMGEALITNRGNLTIKGQGEVAYTYTGEADSAYGKGNYTISNCGTLTIDGATISNNTAKMSHAYYAIDNNSNNTPATLTINSGKVVNTTSYAIRQIANKDNSITVNGGEVEGTRAFWIQLPGSNTAVAPNATLNVNGGTLNATGETGYKLAVYSYNYGNDLKNVKINITDGVVNGDIALTGGTNKTNIESVNISGGTINGDVYSYGKDAIAAEAAINITGGTISNNTLYVLPYVGSNAEQLNIKISEDMVAESAIVIPASATVVLDLNGKTISQTTDTPSSMITNNGTLTIKDSVGGGNIALTYNGTPTTAVAANTISNRGTMVIKGGEISNTGNGNQIGYAIDNYNGSTLTIDGGKVNASGSSYYDAIRLFCGSSEILVTVNSGEISTIWAQNPSNNKASVVYGTVVVNGGSIGTVFYENYTTVKVKSDLNITVTPYGAGSDNTTNSVVDGYTVYSFVH